VHTATFNDFTVNRAFLNRGSGVPLRKAIVHECLLWCYGRTRTQRGLARRSSYLQNSISSGHNGSIGASLMWLKAWNGNRGYSCQNIGRRKETNKLANVSLSIKAIRDKGDYIYISRQEETRVDARWSLEIYFNFACYA
ncbi:hypothetical protein WH47_01913, partial [Habropoda laboriosa]